MCEMEKNEKSPADRQDENRRLLLQASHKDARRVSQNRVQQKYRKWREKKQREYMDGGYKHTFWENLLYFTLIRKDPKSDFDKTGLIIQSISIAVGCVIGQVLAQLLRS